VTQGAPSGPTITPWGADPSPSGISRLSPVAGSRRPSRPDPWAVYQTERPSAAGATSWGRLPAGTGYSCTRRPAGAAPAALVDLARPGGSAPGSEDRSHPATTTVTTASQASNPARRPAPPVMPRY
jgi:hypothetical protein